MPPNRLQQQQQQHRTMSVAFTHRQIAQPRASVPPGALIVCRASIAPFRPAHDRVRKINLQQQQQTILPYPTHGRSSQCPLIPSTHAEQLASSSSSSPRSAAVFIRMSKDPPHDCISVNSNDSSSNHARGAGLTIPAFPQSHLLSTEQPAS